MNKSLSVLLVLWLHLGTSTAQPFEDLQVKGWKALITPNVLIDTKGALFNTKAKKIIVTAFIQPQDYNDGFGSGVGYVNIHCAVGEAYANDTFMGLDMGASLQKLSPLDNAVLSYELCIRQ